MDIKSIKTIIKERSKKLTEAREELEKTKQDLEQFELAIESLEQPTLATVGASPTETMNQILGDATSLEKKQQRLQIAKQASEKHYSDLADLQKSVASLEADLQRWKEKLDWAENYEHLAEELRPKFFPSRVITSRIESNRTSITSIKNTIAQRKTRIDNWKIERAQLIRQLEQQGMGTKNRLNENIPNELKEQNLQDERQIGFIEDRILDDEFQLKQDFRQFVREQVARRNALAELQPDFQQLEEVVRQHKEVARQLQSKLSEFPILSDLIIPIPQEINFE